MVKWWDRFWGAVWVVGSAWIGYATVTGTQVVHANGGNDTLRFGAGITAADLSIAVKNHAPGQIADIRPSRLEFGSLCLRNLQFTSHQNFRVRD